MFGYEVQDGISLQEQFHGKIFKFNREVELAKDFVLKSEKIHFKNVKCPVCGAGDVSAFFEKWGVQYYICTNNWTVFALAEQEVVDNFRKESPLTALRKSDDYQNSLTENRQGVWKNLLAWINHRVYRYSPQTENRHALIRGIRYKGLWDLFKQCSQFSTVDCSDSILQPDVNVSSGYDTLFELDTLQRQVTPEKYLKNAYDLLEEGGLLFLNTRIGSGYDILTLKGKGSSIFPYEHIFLPSVRSLRLLLEKVGFTILEASTPGVLDTVSVYNSRDLLSEDDYFARFLTSDFNERLFNDFQKLLQKHGLSSTVRIVAEKK